MNGSGTYNTYQNTITLPQMTTNENDGHTQSYMCDVCVHCIRFLMFVVAGKQQYAQANVAVYETCPFWLLGSYKKSTFIAFSLYFRFG